MPSASPRSEDTSIVASMGRAWPTTGSPFGSSQEKPTNRCGSGSSSGAASNPCWRIHWCVRSADHAGSARFRSSSASCRTVSEFCTISIRGESCSSRVDHESVRLTTPQRPILTPSAISGRKSNCPARRAQLKFRPSARPALSGAHSPRDERKAACEYGRLGVPTPILLTLPLGWRVAHDAPKLPRYAGA